MEDCVFCKIIAGKLPHKAIFEDKEVIVFLSLQGHPLVVPKKHIATIYDLDDQTGAAVMSAAIKISKAVKKGLNADGVNLIQNNEPAAGQEVNHFHLHIKPRFHNDEVKLHFAEKSDDESVQISNFDKIKAAL